MRSHLIRDGGEWIAVGHVGEEIDDVLLRRCDLDGGMIRHVVDDTTVLRRSVHRLLMFVERSLGLSRSEPWTLRR